MCGARKSAFLASRLRAGKEYRLAACQQCGQHYCDPAPTTDEIRGFYLGDYHLELRNANGTESAFGKKFASYRDWILSFLKGGRCVDIGTATGLLPYMLKQSGFDAEGVEYNSSSVEWGSAHYGIPIRVGGTELVEKELGSFDLISMTDVLEHTENPFHVLQGLYRSLKPRGLIFITFPDIKSIESRYGQMLASLFGRPWLWPYCQIPLHTWEFTQATALNMFEKAGFDAVGFRRSYAPPEPAPGIAKLLASPTRLLSIPPVARRWGTQMEFMIRRRA